MCRSVELTLGKIWLGKKSKKKTGGIHWWSSGEESSSQCRGWEFDPWLGTQIPHATGQLSPDAAPESPPCSEGQPVLHSQTLKKGESSVSALES